MKIQPIHKYVLHQWISCGFHLSHEGLNPEQNRYWYGSLYSPDGCGGNFLISGHLQINSPDWLSEPSLSMDLERSELIKGLKVWDQKYLNDFHWNSPVLSLEAMADQLMSQLQKHSLPDGLQWSELEIKLDSFGKVRFHQTGSISTFYGFRLQSIIENDIPVGVDAQVELEISGDHWQKQVQRTLTPFGVLENWSEIEMKNRLFNETLNQWLGVTTIEDVPEALFHQLKQLVPALISVRLCLEGRENIGYFG